MQFKPDGRLLSEAVGHCTGISFPFFRLLSIIIWNVIFGVDSLTCRIFPGIIKTFGVRDTIDSKLHRRLPIANIDHSSIFAL